jgi:iron complex outermembrane receptor protein
VPPSRAFWRQLTHFALLIGTIARAQEPGETIEVEGKRLDSSPRAPGAAATVIDASQFGGEVRSVADLLLTAPGVSIHALGGPGQVATLSLRGASADQSAVLLDGIPLQGPGGGAVDLSTLPATLLDRVVVSRGVLGAQFGVGALGGAVELLPRSARDKVAGGAQISGGSFGAMRAAADAAFPAGSGSALLAVQADRIEGDFNYARQLTPELPGAPYYGFTRRNADAERLSLLGRASHPLGGGFDLDVLAQGSAGERGLPGPANAITLHSREIDQSVLGGLRLRHADDSAGWGLRAWGRLDRIELRGVQPFGDCQDGSPDCPRLNQRSSAIRAEAEGALTLAETHRIGGTLSAGEERVHGGAIEPHRRSIFSLSASDEIGLPQRFFLLPAVRLDKVGSDAGVSPGLAAIWRAHDAVDVRAGWGLSFRPPTLNELYLESGGIASNPDLRPERAWSLDAGIALHRGPLRLSASVFWSRYRDLIVYELDPPAKVKPYNVGSARIAGAELEAIVQLPGGLLAQAAYSWLDAINLRPGDQQDHRLAYRAPHRLFLRLARRGDRLEGYGECSYTSALPRNAFDSAYEHAQLVFNAGLGVRASGPLWLHLEVRNLLDDQTLEDLFQYPLPGRSISLIARARL